MAGGGGGGDDGFGGVGFGRMMGGGLCGHAGPSTAAAKRRSLSEGQMALGGFTQDDAGGELELVFDEVGDDLGVGFGDELVALGDEHLLQGEVVFDDAVVDDDEGAGAVAVGVGVLFCGAAVGGPAGVADAEGAVYRGFFDDGFEVAELAGSAAEFEAGWASGDGDAGGVVAAVFEAAKTFNDGGDD